MDLLTSYQNKQVFVTGHTGFKGSWLITWLSRLGANIKGYALAPEFEYSLYNGISGDSLCNSVIADIREAEKLKNEILNFQPDFIFHLAAQPLVRLSYEMPAETFEVNGQGTVNVLDALRHLNKPCVAVFVTTDKVYHNLENGHHYKEEDRLGGYDPYSASKACAELIIESYRNSFFNNDHFAEHQKSIASVRAGNVIGGGDWAADRIIPDIIRALRDNKIISVRNPSAVRPWQHVLEPVGAYLLLAARMASDPEQYNESWNFGPYKEDALTVKSVVEKAIQEWGSGSYQTPPLGTQPHEASLLHLDIHKAMNRLQWRPKMNSSEAIHKTIEWYKNITAENILQFTLHQIEEYETLNAVH